MVFLTSGLRVNSHQSKGARLLGSWHHPWLPEACGLEPANGCKRVPSCSHLFEPKTSHHNLLNLHESSLSNSLMHVSLLTLYQHHPALGNCRKKYMTSKASIRRLVSRKFWRSFWSDFWIWRIFLDDLFPKGQKCNPWRFLRFLGSFFWFFHLFKIRKKPTVGTWAKWPLAPAPQKDLQDLGLWTS